MRRIIIIGYMGAGKTTVGRALARDLGLDFYDLDSYIENRMHCTIKNLFDRRGEEGFRLVERAMLYEVAEFENVVISSGGGTPCFFDNMDYMCRQADTVYLRATPEVLHAHLKMGHTVRPLLLGKTDDEVQTFVADHLRQREPIYLRARCTADVCVLDTRKKISDTVTRIETMLGMEQTPNPVEG